MERQTGRRMDGGLAGQKNRRRNNWKDRQTDMWSDRQADVRTEGQMDG